MSAEEKPKLKPCPFCGGRVKLSKKLRFGYENYQDDPDAWAYYAFCLCCAAQGPWRKCESGAIRLWNMRIMTAKEQQQIKALLEDIAHRIYTWTDADQGRAAWIINTALLDNPVISGEMDENLEIREE